MTEAQTYTIPEYRFADFTKKLEKLNRKAVKFGCEKLGFSIISKTKIAFVEPESKRTVSIPAFEITVSGAAPKVGGWTFGAKIETLSDSKTFLVHSVPGVTTKIHDRFRSLGPGVCEHCNRIRARRDTFVVINEETGEQKQVGRQCLADFTGFNTPERAALAYSRIDLFDEFTEKDDIGLRSNFFGDHQDTHWILALTSAYISKYGWVPRSALSVEVGNDRPTSGRVGAHFWRAGRSAEERREIREFEELAHEAKHQERATAIVDWIKNELANNIRSDYDQNLVALTSLDLTTTKHLGLVCSAVAAYQKAQNLKVEYAKKKEVDKNSKHIGKVGERVVLDVNVTFMKLMSGHYGAVTLVKFRDIEGNVLSWFASGDKEFNVGESLKIKATVKKHSEFNEIKETALSRVSVLQKD